MCWLGKDFGPITPLGLCVDLFKPKTRHEHQISLMHGRVGCDRLRNISVNSCSAPTQANILLVSIKSHRCSTFNDWT